MLRIPFSAAAPALALLAATTLASHAVAGNRIVMSPAALRAPGPGTVGSEPDPGAPFALPNLGSDVEYLDRYAAYHNKLGTYFNESFKQHVMSEVARQRQRFPNLQPGALNSSGPVWTAIGPSQDKYTINGVELIKVDSGRLTAIVPNPANKDQLYVVAGGGGLWRTDNLTAAIATWTPLSDALSTTSGGAAAIGRTFDTIYYGLGDAFNVTPAVGGVIEVSTDGGHTFTDSNLPGAGQVREIAVDSSAAVDTVLAATDIGIFQSIDGGLTFNLVTGTGPLAGLEAWSIKRTSAGWLASFVEPGLAINPTAYGTVALSTDDGATWTPISDTTSFANSGRITLAVAKPGEPIVYAFSSDPTGYAQGDMFRSTNGGQNFTALGLPNQVPTNPTCVQTDMNLMHGQAYYNQSLLVDPNDKTRNTVYAGGNLSLAKTTNGGASFTIIGDWLPGGDCADGSTANLAYIHADHHTAAIIGKNWLAFGTDGGLFISKNGGATFDTSRNRGLQTYLTQTISSSPMRDNTLVTGLQDDGTRARMFASLTWNQITGGDGEGVAMSQANTAVAVTTAEYFYFVGFPGGVPPSTDPNVLYANAYDASNGLDLTDPDYFPFFTPAVAPSAKADPTGLVVFTKSGSTVYRTNDGGLNWSQLVRFTDANNNALSVFRDDWNELSVSPNNLNKIAVGGTGGYAIITTDSFATNAHFHYVSLNSLGLGYASYNSSSTFAANDTIYFSSQAPTFGATRIVKTTDYGKSFSAAGSAANGLPDVPVNHVVADLRDKSGNTLYAATWIGVYQSTDGGNTWVQFGAGLPVVQVSSLAISPSSHKLRAATYGRGVWELQLPPLN